MNRSHPQINSEKPLGGRYRIISQLGVGGFGRTFLAEDLHLPGYPRCVVKQLKPKITSDDTLQMARRCFNTEAQVLYRLGIHDQIPRLLAHFEENQEFYLVQEFVEGESLTPELSEGKPWSESRVVVFLKDILQILAFVHQQQVIHRDIKPSNLMRRRQDHRIVLIDFGAVKQVSSQSYDPETGMTNMTISIGTQGYMPNEQIAGKPRFSSDIYAVGVLAIQALTGIHPKHLGEDQTGEIDWHHHCPQTNPQLVQIIDRMVRYHFRERYQSAAEVLEALESLPIAIADSPPLLHVIPETIKVKEADATTSGGANGWSAQPNLEFSDLDYTMSADEPTATTAIWNPTDSSGQPAATVSHAHTQAVGRPHLTGSPETATSAASSKILKWLVQPWTILGGVVMVGLLLAALQTVFPQFLTLSINRNSPSPSPESAAPSAPTASDPKAQSAELVVEAFQMRAKEQYEDALKLYDQAISLDSENATAYAGRCETLNLLDRPEDAIVACDDALAYKPNDPEALWSMGNARLRQNRPYEALQLYEKVTALKPSFAQGWVRRGVALQKLKRSAEALIALDQGIHLKRNSAEAWMTRGEALLTLQRYDQAIVSLNKALQLQPNNTQVEKLLQQAKARQQR